MLSNLHAHCIRRFTPGHHHYHLQPASQSTAPNGGKELDSLNLDSVHLANAEIILEAQSMYSHASLLDLHSSSGLKSLI